MRKFMAACGTALVIGLSSVPAQADQTVNVTPNQQTTTASATSSPSGQNISQQNNFSDPGVNAFGPGIQCAGPYVASSVYRGDSSNPGSVGVGSYANTGGTLGLVIPLNGSNKKCQEFVNEIVFQRQIDTCLSMAKQGFAFDPNGQYADLAKRCSGIHYTGAPIGTANPLSPPPPPTVITVPAVPGSGPALHVQAPGSGAPVSVEPAAVTVPVIPAANRTTAAASYCQQLNASRKKRLIAQFRLGHDRKTALDMLHAACISDSDIMAAL